MLFVIDLPFLVVQRPFDFIEVKSIRFVTKNTSSLEAIDLQGGVDTTLLSTAPHILGDAG
jgi:hypothetical protein